MAGKAEYTKHLLRLRHRSLANATGEAFEIVLVNANGTSAYQMLLGFFRMVCANGLMTGETFNEVRVRHSGDAVGAVIEGAFQVLQDAPRVDRLEQTPLAAQLRGRIATRLERLAEKFLATGMPGPERRAAFGSGLA